MVAQRRVTGLSVEVIANLVAELGPVWHDRQQARLTARTRQRAVGAGARYKLVFVDRLLATLVCLRHGVTHDVLALLVRRRPLDDHPGDQPDPAVAGRAWLPHPGRSVAQNPS